MNNHSLLKTQQLTKSFGSGHTQVHAVKDISIDIAQGELVLIMGPSGSGKTTLLSMIGGLLRPTSGRIFMDNIDISTCSESVLPDIRANKIGFIFQSFNLLEALTVRENILFPAHLRPMKINEAKIRADELIDKLGLSKRRKALPSTLSGGEKQRVAIARALINQPPLILADEPTGNLDSQSGQDVMMLLHDIARDEGCSVILVTHDPRVENIADRILWLEDGSIRDRREDKHAWAQCPVCHMRVDEWTASFVTTYENKHYAFCSERCYQRFQAEPLTYHSAQNG